MQVLPRLFKLLPWVDLDTFYAKVKFGDICFCMGKRENYFFFLNFCSLRSQSCLKHSTQWVNEVEWVSVVKVILWPWSKVTQISKLNVWLLACILRWVIQGLLALLFILGRQTMPGRESRTHVLKFLARTLRLLELYHTLTLSLSLKEGHSMWNQY